VEGHEELALDTGWQAAACAPDAHSHPHGIASLDWLPARVPGTAAAALHQAGRWRPGEASDLDADDWWFRTTFEAAPAADGERVVLELGGIATVAEVFLNGDRVLCSESMFATHAVDVGNLLRDENELSIRCIALGPQLSKSRKPRARWRTRLVHGNLRFYRTMLLGRAPGFAADPAAVGPWRPVRLVRRRVFEVERVRLESRLEEHDGDGEGVVTLELALRLLGGHSVDAVELELEGPTGSHSSTLAVNRRAHLASAEGSVRASAVARWWPHTHGQPALYDVRVVVRTNADPLTVELGRVGFRTLKPGRSPEHELERDGLQLHVNGVEVFARGSVWTPADPIGLAPSGERLRVALELVRDAGMNMLRIPGTSVYEEQRFHDLCDELGILVWQDFMFANLDYPFTQERFRETVEREAEELLGRTAASPSLTVLCGNSEVEQQVAMLGLEPALGRGKLFGEVLPQLVAASPAEAVYVPSAPCGGALPFRPDRGIANYYGVGGYRRPLSDARRADVRFAAECLAFSNVPNEDGVRATCSDGDAAIGHGPEWKSGVPRDAGAGWDFEDVRDHYLRLLYDLDPGELRRVDPERYLELSRAVTGEVMADVMGEWRRPRSPCGGGLVLWFADLAPGAGWGLIDSAGAPKPAYYHLRRALAPVAIWMTDEGLGGLRVHVANDRPRALVARLRVALYRDGEQCIANATAALDLPGHGAREFDVEELLGHFVDVSWAYRFGPASHDAVVASVEADQHDEPLAQAFRFPAGPPLRQQKHDELGLEADLVAGAGEPALRLISQRLAWGVRIHIPGRSPADDAITLEPGVPRTVALLASNAGRGGEGGELGAVSALNLRGRVPIRADDGRREA
jgi:beta-mannosidase